ncbi:MAG: hypothetical protein MUO54_14835 [Anaerolineales bacterium]|nr:hypothetical protein [Anaerolineales bacterium]
MKKLLSTLNSRPKLYYLTLFLLMIVPGILLYFAARSGSGTMISVFLGLVVLANAAAVLK